MSERGDKLIKQWRLFGWLFALLAVFLVAGRAIWELFITAM